MIDFRKRLQDEDARRAFERFEQRCGRFGERERRVVPITVEEVRDSGAGEGQFTVKGHGAVFNRKSLDLGGFQEVIAPGFFDDVLDRSPDVHLLWDHDTRLALARTYSSKYQLELRTDPRGLHYWARVAPTTFAADLRVLMDGGVIDQASFAFTVEDDTWEIKTIGGTEVVIRNLLKARDLFDVTITAQGAYPQTDSQVVRAYALDYAVSTGRLASAEPEGAAERGATTEDVASAEPAGADETPVAHSGAGGAMRRDRQLADLAFRARQVAAQHRHALEMSK
jgi:HK97 family phage prohead protease